MKMFLNDNLGHIVWISGFILLILIMWIGTSMGWLTASSGVIDERQSCPDYEYFSGNC